MARAPLLINVAVLGWVIAWLPAIRSFAHAQNENSPFDLQWTAPSACMSSTEARAEISALIRGGRQAAAHSRARVLIEGSEKGGYVARIEIARGESAGERELHGARCDDIAEAAVLIIAMAIDPEGAAARAAASAERSQPSASPSAQASAARDDAPRDAAAPDDVAREPQPAEPRESEPGTTEEELEEEPADEAEEPSDPKRAGRFALGLRGGGDAGSLPEVTLGGGLLAGLHWQRVRLELHALAYLPQLERRGPTPVIAAEISLYTGALSGCFDLLGSRDEDRALGACAAVEAGLSRGEPQQISDGRSSAGLWLAGLLGLDVRQHVVGPLHLRLLAEAGVPVLRPSYEIEPFGRVFRASSVLGRFGISAFVLFP